jgi:predicted cation transporter
MPIIMGIVIHYLERNTHIVAPILIMIAILIQSQNLKLKVNNLKENLQMFSLLSSLRSLNRFGDFSNKVLIKRIFFFSFAQPVKLGSWETGKL